MITRSSLKFVENANLDSSKCEAFGCTPTVFAGTGFDEKPDDLLDLAQVGMLEGRTIHFHFQFIEPGLLSQHPGAIYSCADEPVGALSLSKVVTQQAKKVSFNQPLRSRFGGHFSVYGSPTEVSTMLPVLHEAFSLLEAMHLDWLPVLSIGAFEIGLPRNSRAEFCAQIAPGQTPDQTAKTLISQAAASLASAWLSVEATFLGSPDSERNIAADFAARLLSTIMLEELEHRRRDEWRKLPELESPEVLLAGFPLTRHLVTFWNRRWNRQAFLRGSVFDYAPTLSALYCFE